MAPGKLVAPGGLVATGRLAAPGRLPSAHDIWAFATALAFLHSQLRISVVWDNGVLQFLFLRASYLLISLRFCL